jgi:hypothetical protein
VSNPPVSFYASHRTGTLSKPARAVAEDFALMEASYAVVRILQTFPATRLPPGVPNEPVGAERQNLTIVLSSAEGTKVLLE